MKKLSFGKLFWIWFVFALLAHTVNGLTLKSPLLASLSNASLGIFLLFHPVYPQKLVHYWEDKTCKNLMRLLAILNILISFAIRSTF